MAIKIIRNKLPIDEDKDEEKSKPADHLLLQGRFRWHILINILVLCTVFVPFFLPVLVAIILNGYFLLNWILFLVIAIIRHFRITQKFKKYENINADKIKFVVSKYNFIMMTVVYMEPIELISKCLQNLHEIEGSEDLIITVCFEEKTSDLEVKIKLIAANFESKFKELVITVHPHGTLGEIPGKCSNSNYGIRSLFNHLKETCVNFRPDDYILTNFDVDTIFHKYYLNALKAEVSNEKSVDKVIWQPLLYYNWKFDKLSFYTRIIGIFRSTLMAGALVTFNINVMSAFSASLKLYVDGNFVHPFYQMDDIICYIRWMAISKSSKLKIKPIYCLTLSGPTSGDTMWKELKEIIRQSQRWAIGSAEVFHYFVTKIQRINFFIGLLWSFCYLNYYAGFLCANFLLSISTTIKLVYLLFSHSNSMENTFYLKSFVFVFPLLMYVTNGLMIVLNKIAVRTFLKELNVKENLGLLRELVHYILSWPTQIFYSLIFLYGFFAILIFGKKCCKHEASKKDELEI
jgi:hypothetical protein